MYCTVLCIYYSVCTVLYCTVYYMLCTVLYCVYTIVCVLYCTVLCTSVCTVYLCGNAHSWTSDIILNYYYILVIYRPISLHIVVCIVIHSN